MGTGGGPKPEGGGFSPGGGAEGSAEQPGRHAGVAAPEKAGHSPCPQLGIAPALGLPLLRQTCQALLACLSTGRKMKRKNLIEKKPGLSMK